MTLKQNKSLPQEPTCKLKGSWSWRIQQRKWKPYKSMWHIPCQISSYKDIAMRCKYLQRINPSASRKYAHFQRGEVFSNLNIFKGWKSINGMKTSKRDPLSMTEVPQQCGSFEGGLPVLGYLWSDWKQTFIIMERCSVQQGQYKDLSEVGTGRDWEVAGTLTSQPPNVKAFQVNSITT